MTSSPEHPLHAFGKIGSVLLRTLEAERISPSYLLEGTDSETLREAAFAFAAGVLAGSPPAPMDERVFRLAVAGRHPDLHVLTKDKATVISVAALTPVLARAYTTPLECSHQVFIIDPAEAMDAAGIARYLKALEEPPEGTVFILLSVRPERLPDTVLSRCRRLRFPPLDDEALMASLARGGMPESDAHRVARFAGGSIGRARRMQAHGVIDVAIDLVTAARASEAGVGLAAETALSHLTREAAELAAADTSETDTKRQHVRHLLSDVLRVLSIEARDAAAGRPGVLLRGVDAESAIELLEAWGSLDAAVAMNVTPAVVLIEMMGALRRNKHLHG